MRHGSAPGASAPASPGGPLPSRRVLDEFYPSWPGRGAAADAASSVDLDAALAAHALAILAVDRAEAAFTAARASADAADPGRVRGHGVCSKRRAFMVRHARQLRLDRRARDLAVRLQSTPAAGLDDIALKLAVVIAAGEAGPPDAAAFPWSRLRQILAELLAIGTAGT